MSAVVAHPAWQPAPVTPARPARRRPGAPAVRRGNLQLVGPGYVPPVGPVVGGAPRNDAGCASASPAALRLTVRGRRVVTALALLLATTVSVGLGAWAGIAANPSGETATTTVTVGAGETLWSLATAAATPGEDPRDVVEAISTLNGLASSELAVGQELLVPVK